MSNFQAVWKWTRVGRAGPLDPLGEELGPFDGEEEPEEQPNLKLDPLGGTTLGCRSCLGWGTSQVQPGVDCHQIKTDVRQ